MFIKSFPKNFQDRLHEVECDVKVSKHRESSVGKKKERSLGWPIEATFTPVLPHYSLIQTIHLSSKVCSSCTILQEVICRYRPGTDNLADSIVLPFIAGGPHNS